MPPVIDPFKRFIDPNADAVLAANPDPTAQAPDLTGYFDQLNTSRNPVHVAGIDEQAADEQKREEEARQAQFENTNPDIQAKKADALATLLAPEKLKAQNALDVENLKAGIAANSDASKETIAAEKAANSTKALPPAEEDAIQAMAKAQPIIKDLRSTLNPSGNQAMSWLWNNATNKAYNAGISVDPTQEKKTQLSGLLSVVGSMPYAGRSRSFQMIQQAMKHLTQPGQSDAMMSHQLDEIDNLWPQMQQEIVAAHQNPGGVSVGATTPSGVAVGNDPAGVYR